MAELLLEIRSEEIPARMQMRAGADLARLLSDALAKSGLEVKNAQSFYGARRLVFVCEVPLRSPDINEERKGPRLGAPEQAIAGFMRASGIQNINEAEIRSDKKGDYYVAVLSQKGKPSSDIIAEIVPEIMAKFPWPKSMKSGDNNFRWVRPLSSIICLLDGKTVPFVVGGIKSGNLTEGHRRMGCGEFSVKNFKDYKSKLGNKGHVVLSADERKKIILENARAICKKHSLELIEDAGLLDEVAGLVEWPVVLLGNMDKAFLELPAEVIRLSMREHQKYFAVRDKAGKLAPYFIVVANQIAPDGGKEIAKGNARVLSARLDDARFFATEDARRTLESRFGDLGGVVFHQKLGTIKDKTERLMALARELAPKLGADPDKAEKAAKLAKCDLVTNMVVEFTSLQGQIGRLMYEKEGGDKDIALAIEEHYKPKGANDSVPTNPVSIAVSIADRLDTLIGFWGIDEKPTGSKDPYALRRAALGIVRILLENEIRLNLSDYVNADLLDFIKERLRIFLRDQDISHDIVDAVFAVHGDDLVDITNRVKALKAFLANDDGANLLAGYKRAVNILKAEAKKSGLAEEKPDKGTLPQETALFGALETTTPLIETALENEDYGQAMQALARLRKPIDAFFDKVIVNSDNEQERKNRLALLISIRNLAARIADFDKVE